MARVAAEELVVGVLDPGFADLVARLEALELGLLQLFFVDLADVADDVGGAGAVGVVADEDPLHGDAGELVLVLFDVGDQVEADVAPQRHRGAGGDFFPVCDRPADLAQGHVRELPQPRQLGPFLSRVLGQFRGVQLQRQAGAVVDQDFAVAVEDVAARGDHFELAGAVVLRLGQVLVAGEHLQVPEAEEENREEGDADAADDRHP